MRGEGHDGFKERITPPPDLHSPWGLEGRGPALNSIKAGAGVQEPTGVPHMGPRGGGGCECGGCARPWTTVGGGTEGHIYGLD